MAFTDHAQRPTSLDSLSAFGDLAIASFACLAIAAALGVLFALVLRHRGFAWTWSLLSLAPLPLWLALVLSGLLGLGAAAISLVLTLGFALGAISWGVHGQIDDRRAGGDRELATRELRGPLDLLHTRMARRAQSVKAALADGVPIGRTHKGELASVARGDADSGAHVLIPGATGAGKTTSLAALLVDYVVRSGFGAVVLEAKSDRHPARLG